MAKIIQITCDGYACLNVLEVADDEEYEIQAVMDDMGWENVAGDDLCPDCLEKLEGVNSDL